MNREQKRVKQDKGSDDVQKVIVAVKASKEIPKIALVWALTHVVQLGDCITLLVVVPSQSSGKKFWGFPRFAGDCASGHKKAHSGTSSEQKCDITDSCSQMILQLHDVYDPNKINVKIKIVSGSPSGAVAAEAKRAQASWVVLDRQLKHEEKCCMEELQCNIVVMKRSQPKVLRLNLVGSPKKEPEMPSPVTSDVVVIMVSAATSYEVMMNPSPKQEQEEGAAPSDLKMRRMIWKIFFIPFEAWFSSTMKQDAISVSVSKIA